MQRRLVAIGGLVAAVFLVVLAAALLLDQRFAPVLFGEPRQPAAILLPADPIDQNVPIDPGWYFVEVDGYRYTFNIPTSGFVSTPGRNILADSGHFAALAFLGNPRFVYTDPCHWEGTEATTGKTASDFVAAVAGLAALTPLRLDDVTIDGRSAKQIRIGVGEVDFESCDEQQVRSYEGRGGYQTQWSVDDLTAIDFDNGDRAVVLVSYTSGPPKQIYGALQFMVDSLRIDPVP